MHAIDDMDVTLRNPADIGALIRARRRTLGLEQAELAARAGVSRLWISQVERGTPGAGIGLVLRTFAALGVELIGGENGAARPAAGAQPPPVYAHDINAIVANARKARQ